MVKLRTPPYREASWIADIHREVADGTLTTRGVRLELAMRLSTAPQPDEAIAERRLGYTARFSELGDDDDNNPPS
jgi:hypothetical protein